VHQRTQAKEKAQFDILMQQGAPTEAAQTQVNATITQLQGLPAAELVLLLQRERRIHEEQLQAQKAQLQAQLQAQVQAQVQAQQAQMQAQQAQMQDLQTQLELLRVQHAGASVMDIINPHMQCKRGNSRR